MHGGPADSFFYPAFFNKWQLFKWLGKSQKTKSYIPHTVRWAKTKAALADARQIAAALL